MVDVAVTVVVEEAADVGATAAVMAVEEAVDVAAGVDMAAAIATGNFLLTFFRVGAANPRLPIIPEQVQLHKGTALSDHALLLANRNDGFRICNFHVSAHVTKSFD